jgi:flavin reductase (DIM6/NTAB) family NADH-FMN oxidoreductase RutF
LAHFLSNELPDDLYRRLEGNDLEACAEKVILICSVDAHGWPHPAMLSYFEVIAKDRRNIRLAAYKNSRTTENMRRNGKLTVLIIDERAAYYIKGHVEELEEAMNCSPQNSKLNLRVEQVLADEADQQSEAGAYVVGGITYKSPHLAAERQKAKEVLAELLG